MRVEVTEADILGGQPGDTGWCPIAIALKRAAGADHAHVTLTRIAAYHVDVKSGTIEVSLMKEWDTPFHISVLISRFDTDRIMSPFTFEL